MQIQFKSKINFLMYLRSFIIVLVFFVSQVEGTLNKEFFEDENLESRNIIIGPFADNKDDSSEDDSSREELIPKVSPISTISHNLEISPEPYLNEIQDLNPLINYIHKHIIHDQSIAEIPAWKVFRYTAKGIAILYGSLAGLPFISSSCKAAQGNKFFCIAFAAGNVLSYGSATTWAGLRLTKALNPISMDEKQIFDEQKSCAVLKHILCNCLGLLASVPATYIAYTYNPKEFKFLAVPALLTSYMFATLGYYELTESDSMLQTLLSRIKTKDNITKKADMIKNNVLSHITNHSIPTLLHDDEALNQLFNTDSSPSNIMDSTSHFVRSLLSLRSDSNIVEGPENWMGGYPRNIIRFGSIILPIGGTIVSYLLTKEAANLMTKSPIFSSIFAIASVIPTFTLDILATTTTVTNIFDNTYNLLKHRSPANLLSTSFPKMYYVIIPLTSVTLACLSVAGAWKISYDALDRADLEYLLPILPTVVFSLNAIFESFSMRNLLHDAFSYFITFKTDGLGDKAKKIGKLEKFMATIKSSISTLLCDFWDRLSLRFMPLQH